MEEPSVWLLSGDFSLPKFRQYRSVPGVDEQNRPDEFCSALETCVTDFHIYLSELNFKGGNHILESDGFRLSSNSRFVSEWRISSSEVQPGITVWYRVVRVCTGK